MTRINLVPPSELCDKHLIAEYRELPRIFKLSRICNDAPPTYVLGEGHVKFFYDKLKFLYERQRKIVSECKSRNMKVQYDPDGLLIYKNDHNWNDYIPSDCEIELNRYRINERLVQMKSRGGSRG